MNEVFGDRDESRRELTVLQQTCQVPNWDGFAALPVSQKTLDKASRFLDNLPVNCPAPSIGAEPDGAITLEWHRSARCTVSVSVSEDDRVDFAAVFGSNSVYGTTSFVLEVPETILDLIRQVCFG